MQRDLATRLSELAAAAWEPALGAERSRQAAMARRAHGEFVTASEWDTVHTDGSCNDVPFTRLYQG